MELPALSNQYLIHHAADLQRSFQQQLKRGLLPQTEPEDFAKALFHARLAVLSHNNDADPLFNYANLKALELFGYAWSELVGLPSRLSAEADNWQKRGQILAKVAEKGFVEHYQGVRISKNGDKFLIKNTIIWNVYDTGNRLTGQAACFDDWQFL